VKHTPRVLVLDDREQLIRRAPGADRLRDLGHVEFLDEPLSGSGRDFAGVEVLMAVRERTTLTADVLRRFPDLQLILQTGGHAYHLDGVEASRRGIPVALGRRAQAVRRAMPELTFLLALAAVRRLPEAQSALAKHTWTQPIGRTLHGRRLGILGLGRHGRGVAALGAAFGMEVVAAARSGSPGTAAEDGPDVPRLPLDEVLATADVVTVHLRLSEESRGLLDGARLQAMKDRSILVNTSRGAIVDEGALVQALRHGPLAAAGLDVFADEPLPDDSPLRDLPNVVMTPHVGWTVEEVFEEFAQIAADQLRDFLDGRLDRAELQDPDVETGRDSMGGLSERG
jgi:phosphoglycerate dehydrogenase-like enzyme